MLQFLSLHHGGQNRWHKDMNEEITSLSTYVYIIILQHCNSYIITICHYR